MPLLVVRAYLRLIQFDLYVARGDFGALYAKVRKYPLRKIQPQPNAVELISSAVDMACIWYWKEVLCLQRSAATACLLRGHGVRAQMMIGAQQRPFSSHAWVEVDGQVVNDRPYIREKYTVLDQC
jgi:hypothetical protein